VATLGDSKFAFVLDTAGDESPRYDLLYFDVNGNGDLTDDGVIESVEWTKAKKKKEKEKAKEKAKGKDGKKKEGEKKKKPRRNRRTEHHPSAFPTIDLMIEVGGEKIEYPVLLSAYYYEADFWTYASASLRGRIYREGEVELDGRKQRIVLVDYNNNGRFDDRTRVTSTDSYRGNLAEGDVIYLDPKPVTAGQEIWSQNDLEFRGAVGKVVRLNGKLYDLKVSPTGDEATIEPSKAPIGFVKSTNENYHVVVVGDVGVFRLKGTKDQAIALPAGEWKVASYVIDLTNIKPPEEKGKDGKKEKKKKADLFEAIGKGLSAMLGIETSPQSKQRPTTIVSAQASPGGGKPVKVVKDQTVVLPFGAPFSTAVELVHYDRRRDAAYLSLVIHGADGAVVNGMRVNGGRPGKPKLKITDPDGKTVVEGNFEYG
jgi:hypothetical protein